MDRTRLERIEKPVTGFGSVCFEALPNFFQINGYGTNLVLHGAATILMEIQTAFSAARMLEACHTNGSGSVFEISSGAVDDYRLDFKAMHDSLIWSEAPEKQGWYWGISRENPTKLPMTMGRYIEMLKGLNTSP